MSDLWTRRIASLLLGGLIGVYTPESVRLFVLGVFVMLALRIVLWRPRDFWGLSFRPEILILGAGVLAGLLYGYMGSLNIEPPLVLDRVQVTGELTDWNTGEDGATGSFVIIDDSQTTEKQGQGNFRGKKYRLKVYPNAGGELPEGWTLVRPGDTLRFTAKIEQPKPPGTAGQFDLPLYYAVRGFSGGITAKGNAEIITPGDPPFSWTLRSRVRQLLEQISSSQTGVLEGILFGDTSRIPEEDLEQYRITGVYHVFSASGSNVAFLFILCWGVLRFLPSLPRTGITILVLVFYAILCGGNPPILRATLMGVLVLLGRLGSGRSHSLRGLLLAALILFFWQPLNLKDIGFQLSFMATWGIIVLSPRLMQIQRIKSWPPALKIALTTTCAAQIATLPFLISTFHRLSLIGVIANLGVLFILGSIFQLGIIGVIFSFLPFAALPLFQVSLWLLEVISGILFQLARMPLADVWVVNPGILFWVCWYGGISVQLIGKERVRFTLQVWVRSLRRRLGFLGVQIFGMVKKVLPFPVDKEFPEVISLKLDRALWEKAALFGLKGERIVLIFLVLLLLWSPWNTPHALEVTFIDVGQGDSILIETPKGARVLVDTGPKTSRFDAGERIVLPYLLQKGINRLDALILTHAHADHVGGAGAILGAIPVDWVGIPENGEDWLSLEAKKDATKSGEKGWGEERGLTPELVTQLAQKGVRKMTAGDRLVLDSEVQISVLAPGGILEGTHSDENNNSIILRLESPYGQSVLLTADMEEEEMEEIMKTGQDFSADLFKIPHHGSRFSLVTDWLDQIDPQTVIISVGKNSFGHPNSNVLKYWEDRQIPIYRTDDMGTIRVRLDKKGIEVLP
ncbi:DNA internalization-related competence protein ComEC/Rec2 [Desulfitobacterium sp.]|uniref:DNA internalization-related competence protein ComEC/Rec2 n=1 Tax=Desulfitobacterium sp. TaxID=49981 RepID=UPI002B21262F|nr:DNA internalization-related competence protein ComEC/Rec2 [Desulfitobacterium sp.]MEA4902304.1 DNA internalization-related competence protein ComEC/Rec2 [Desulfitobacterium sp.]